MTPSSWPACKRRISSTLSLMRLGQGALMTTLIFLVDSDSWRAWRKRITPTLFQWWSLVLWWQWLYYRSTLTPSSWQACRKRIFQLLLVVKLNVLMTTFTFQEAHTLRISIEGNYFHLMQITHQLKRFLSNFCNVDESIIFFVICVLRIILIKSYIF